MALRFEARVGRGTGRREGQGGWWSGAREKGVGGGAVQRLIGPVTITMQSLLTTSDE